MSPRGRSSGREAPKGSGPDGRVTPDDIRDSVRQLAGGVESQVQAKVPLAKYVAIGGAAAVVLVAFWLGRRSGRRRSTIVEIRRG
ncbi:MAG TPA: hypothetical protein VL984_00600 [Acidimicrobiales bacterium]|nr:hypothetical protein [Acidimicrobiales bacterium]